MSRLRPWVPVLLWGVLMFTLSTDAFSAGHTGRFIIAVLHRIFPAASAGTLELLHTLIRKCAHVVEYFIFGLLLFRAVRADRVGWTLRWGATALLLAALFAASDEFHQSFVPSRGASVHDVLLDITAAAAAIWFTRMLANRHHPPATA